MDFLLKYNLKENNNDTNEYLNNIFDILEKIKDRINATAYEELFVRAKGMKVEWSALLSGQQAGSPSYGEVISDIVRTLRAYSDIADMHGAVFMARILGFVWQRQGKLIPAERWHKQAIEAALDLLTYTRKYDLQEKESPLEERTRDMLQAWEAGHLSKDHVETLQRLTRYNFAMRNLALAINNLAVLRRLSGRPRLSIGASLASLELGLSRYVADSHQNLTSIISLTHSEILIGDRRKAVNQLNLISAYDQERPKI
jgi:hypothetical protein